MNAARMDRFAVTTGAIVLAILTSLSGLVWAQTTPAPAPPPAASTPDASGSGAGATGMAVVLVVVALLVVVGVIVKIFDLKRKREAEAVHLQAQVSDALLREGELAGLAITPTAHVPLWNGSPATIELAGQVPSDALHDQAVKVSEREAQRIRSDVNIEDRIGVVPSMESRPGREAA
jgi:hypothetical protein